MGEGTDTRGSRFLSLCSNGLRGLKLRWEALNVQRRGAECCFQVTRAGLDRGRGLKLND